MKMQSFLDPVFKKDKEIEEGREADELLLFFFGIKV